VEVVIKVKVNKVKVKVNVKWSSRSSLILRVR
jgi:hypothetical protein